MCCTLREGERERERDSKGREGGHEGSTVARSRQGLRSDFRKKFCKNWKNLHFIFAIFWVVCVNNFVQPLLSYFAEFSASWQHWRAGVGKGGVGWGRGEELYVTDTFVTCANIHRYPAFAFGLNSSLLKCLSILYLFFIPRYNTTIYPRITLV